MPGHRDRRPREHAAEMGRECGIQCGAVSHSTRNRFNRFMLMARWTWSIFSTGRASLELVAAAGYLDVL